MLKTKKLGAKKLVAAASSLALVGGLAVAAPAAAAEVTTDGATFTWKISECVFNPALAGACGSLQQDQAVSGDVTRGANGFVFSNGVGTYDDATGDTEINFTGSVQVGNKVQGGYAVKFVDPTITVEDGVGKLEAKIETRNPGNNGENPFVDKGRVTVLDLPTVDKSTEWTAQPEELVSQDANLNPNPATPSFSYAFQGLFSGALAGVRPWFRQSASSDGQGGYTPNSNNPNKVASDISAKLYNPKLELVGATGIPVNKTKTITVKGTGFDPSLRTQGLYVTFGPNASTIDKQNISNQDAFYSAIPLFGAYPNDAGEFQTSIKVAGIYKSGQGKTYDGRKTALGVSVWAAHTDAVPSYRQFAKINFVQGAVSYSKPGKVKSLKRKLAKNKKKAKVSWKAPTATKAEFRNNKAIRYQVRVTNYKGKKYGSWKNRSSRSLTFSTKRKGTYKVQIRAVSKAGAGSARGVTIKRR